MAPHGFLDEFQCCLAIALLGHEALEDFAFVVHGAPEVVLFAVDLHENLVEVPTPLMSRSHSVDASAPDLGSEHRPGPSPPEPHGFVANLDTALMEQIFNIPERQREPDVEHDRHADDLGRGFEIAKRGTFGHARTLPTNCLHLKSGSPDRAVLK